MTRLGLRGRLLAGLIGMMVLAIVLVTSVTVQLLHGSVARESRQHRLELATLLGAVASGGDPSGSLDTIGTVTAFQRHGTRLQAEGIIEQAALIDAGGRVIASVPEDRGVPEDWSSEVALHTRAEESAAIVEGDLAIAPLADGRGAVVLLVSGEARAEREAVYQRAVLLYILLDAALLFGLGYLLLTYVVIRPVRRLTRAVDRATRGDLSVRLSSSARDELGELSRGFDVMLQRLDDVNTDLSERIAALSDANAALERAQDELVLSEKLAMIGQVAAGVAHEVGNPLAAVIGMNELLVNRIEDPESHDLSVRIAKELDRMHLTIRELLDYARTGARRDEAIQIADVVTQAVGLCAHHPNAGRLVISRHIADDLPTVHGDPGRLAQVLVNLIINAGDAMDGHGRVDIRARRVEGDLVLSVEDNGPGIPESLLGSVFAPFVSTKGAGKGTGLGLAISERIVTELGGTIRVVSEPGAGTTFTMRFPIGRREST